MYSELSALPLPTTAQFISPSSIRITFTVRDHVRNVKRTIAKVVSLPDLNPTGFEEVPGEVISTLTSPSQSFRAVLRDTKSSRFVEIWSTNSRLIACKDVTALHGQFYSDQSISSLAFSPSECSLLYVAEQNPPAGCSPDDPFAKFRYTPSFGEGLSNFKRPAIFILSWPSPSCDSQKIPQPQLYQLSIPTTTTSDRKIYFCQVVFRSDNEIYATGHELMPDGRLLGIKYCTNRPSGIWRICFTYPNNSAAAAADDCATITCTGDKLTPSQLSCRSPRVFANSGGTMLAYLSCAVGGPHMSANCLHVLPLSPSTPPPVPSTTLVPVVYDPAPNSFPGLFPPYSLATSFFVHDETWDAPKIVTHSLWASRNTIVFIDTQTGEVVDATPMDDGFNWNWCLLTTDSKNKIICSRSCPSVPHQVLLGTVSAVLSVGWKVVHEPEVPEQIQIALTTLETKVMPVPNRCPVETIVIRSTKFLNEQDRPPCILIPHGGPHSTSTTEFNPLSVAFALDGYTLALPNYTGSLGFGQSAVLRLIGKCGTLDVEDCMEALRHLVGSGYAQLGRGKVFIHGGSHGGFLGAHLVGQFPEVFTAAVLRNPVISAGEISSTDIPDWYYAEFDIPYPVPMDSSSGPSSLPGAGDNSTTAERSMKKGVSTALTPSVYEKLYNASPIRLAENVTADVLLLIGKDDLRVAPTQGYTYYHTLKVLQYSRSSGNPRVEMLVFDGEAHPLEGVECARVGWEASRAWFADASLQEVGEMSS